MTDRHTYTGKELTTLLEQVRRELGSEATIVEANKVRSGGVAGFFATESYEVVATSAQPEPVELDSAEEIDLDGLNSATKSDAGDSQRTGRSSIHTALLDRADAISVQERIELSRPPERRREPEVHVRAEDSDKALPLGVPFIDVLTNELDRSELAGPDTEQREQATMGRTARQEPDLAADRPDPPPTRDVSERSLTVSPSAFWARVEAIEEDFVPLEVDGLVTSIVGDLDACLSLAKKLELDGSEKRRELIVVTQGESPPIDDVHHVRNNDELDDLLRYWLSRNRECLVVVDRRVGARATSHLRHARLQGPGVQRLVVTANESATDLLERVERYGHNSVVDLAFSVEPGHVIDLVEAGVPIATVAGHRLDQALLAALACCVSNEL